MEDSLPFPKISSISVRHLPFKVIKVELKQFQYSSINIPKECFFSVHQYWENDKKQRQVLIPVPPLPNTSASEEGIAGVALAALNYSEFNTCVTVLPPLPL